MEVRMALELLAIRLAVQNCRPEDVEELKEVHASFLEADVKKDFVQLIMLDELFHSKIMAISQNSLLVSINDQLLEAFRVFRSSSFANEGVYHNAVMPHAKILECFITKNAELAVQEMRNHLEITARDMESIYSTSRSL
jgi:GntR family transcriptional repressor for pyruvate dehydrogenase complex